MANLLSMASQLQAATSSSGGLNSMAAAAQASSSVASVSRAVTSGTDRARAALASVKPPFGADLLSGGRGGGRNSTAIPSDGTRCEECGEAFGLLRRRAMCGSCDRYLCGSCLGSNALALVGITCLCGSQCPRCRDQSEHSGEFRACRAAMESGAGVTLTLPDKASRGGGFFGGAVSSSAPRRLSVWWSLDCDRGELLWASLEQRQGKPLIDGGVPVNEILAVRNTGMLLELSVKGYSKPWQLDFGTVEERDDWTRYIELAVQVLVSEDDRADLDAARASHRQREMEERQALNQERRKKLSENLGTRFTAEAMMNRATAQSSAPSVPAR